MEKAKISAIQLFIMMFIFEMGTAVIISYGITAKKDAWLAILLGLCLGIVLFFICYFLFRQYPALPLTAYARKIFGTYLGWLVGLVYVGFFLYIGARNVREFGELMISSALPDTPLLAIIILFVLTICYVLYHGIEVLGRTAEVFFVLLVLFGIVGNTLVLVSGNVKLHNLQPFLEYGWKPIVTTAFPHTFVFPFGEMIVFTMLLPYLNQARAVKKVGLSALIVSGVILMYTTSLNIAVLGVSAMERATFPLLATVSKVDLLDFLQRLDAIVVFTLMITVFFKAAVYLYCTVIGLADLFKLKNHQQILLPIGCVVIILSLTMAANFAEQGEEGFITVHYYLGIPLFIIIPLFMLILIIIRSHLKKRKDDTGEAKPGAT